MAQHQDLKRKGGADPDHQMSRNHSPPPLSIEVPKMSDLPNKSKPWSDVHLPVDILLLTVEDCEFLACYAFLKNSIKSYHQTLGYVYFGTMGESGEEALKVALMRCYEGCSAPGGSLVTAKNAVRELRPKAAFLVGFCMGLNAQATKLGDVVLSSKLSTEQFTAPVRRNIGKLNLFSIEGWNPPLKDPVSEKTVQVHRDSDIFSGSQFITKQRRTSQSRVIAVEREGEGLFAAAHDMNIEWVIVKGISHFSDDSNTPDESWKSFASIMAASVVSNMLNDPVVFKEWPHYEDLTAKNQPETTKKPDKRIPDSVCLEECQKQLRSLYETSSKVRIIPWDQNSAVDIDKIYTDLSWVMDDRTPMGVIQEELDHYTEIFAHGEPRHAPKRILVYGQPGIGKTVFTKKATFDWSQQRYSETLGAFDLVLLVRLRDVSNLQDVPSILRACEVLDSKGAISVDNLYDYICRHQEKVLLILDGYDEYVYSSKNESPVFKIWKKSQLRDCCVVITSREMKAETLRNCSDAQFKIDGFNDERQEEFARRFLKDDEDVEEFFEYLQAYDLIELAQIPLLLLMCCLLWTKTSREKLPKERADIFAQFMTTMFDHMCEKKSAESVSAKDYSDELYALGRLAFEALLQGQLYFPVSQLPAGYSLIERLIEVGLFQVLNMASLNREKGVYFIHKSVQEYLAGNFLKEELTSKKAESTNSLLKLDSVKKIREMFEVLTFAVQLSEEAARDILIQLVMAAKKEELTEFKFDNETPSENDLSEEQTDFINLCNQLFFYCSAETRKNLFPTFLFSLGGVLVIDELQLNVIVEEKLVQTTETPNYVFFHKNSYFKDYTEQDYSNLIILTQQLNAVIVSSAGEKKASEFLSNLTWRRIDDVFLKKEENNTHLYLAKIVTQEYGSRCVPFPCDIIKALISKQETTKKTNMNGDESSEESSSSCCSKRHGLSRVWWIVADGVNRSVVELMSEMMQFITAPHEIWVWGEYGEVYDAELTESLLRSIQVTHKLKRLRLQCINVTSSPAVEFINNLFKKAPNLEELNMSDNRLLGAGVDSLIKHLSCAPHLETLELYGVKMTPQQVMDLSSAIKQHGNITYLRSDYHDVRGSGHPKPEHEWPSEEDWEKDYPSLFSNSSNESQPQKQQIPAETPLSIHDSPFPADDQDTVRRTFLAPPDPTVEPMLTEASIPTAHGSSRGLVPQVQYSEHFSLPDIHTHHHSAPSTIFTPGESLSTDPYLISAPGRSTVTQEEPIDEEMWPQTEIQDLHQLERFSLKESETRPSTQNVPSHDSGTAGPVPVTLHSAGAPIPTSHFSSHSLAPFSEHPFRHRVLESPLPAWQPRSTVPGYPYPRSSGISTDGLTPVHPGYLPLRGMQDLPQQRVQPQNTTPGYLNLEGSAVTYPQEIPGFLPPHGMQGARLHGLQPQSTMSDNPYLIGPGVSTHTHSTVHLESLLPHGTLRSPQYGFHSQSASPSYPHLQFSVPVTSSVIHAPVIPGNRMTAPLQAQPQPQSTSPGDSYLSGPVTSSVTYPPVIPRYLYPYGNRMRARLLAPQPQSASPRDSFISGPITSSVTHPSVIPGYSYPYGNHLRAPLTTVSPFHTTLPFVEEYSRKRKNLERHKVRRRDKVPREIKAQGPEAKLAYRNALKTGKVKVYRARIMLIGQDRAGKTSLKKSFLGLPFDPEEDSTDGIEVDPSKFEVDIDQVKNWKRTDKKLSVSQFALDLAKMVAKEIQKRGKDKEEDDEENGDDDYDYEKEGKKQKAKNSKLDYPDEDTNKQTKMGQSGLNSPGEPRLSKPPVVNSQMNQETSRKARKETKTAAPAVELNIDATLPPEEFTDYLDQILKGLNLQTDATAVEHHMILDLWDFAGQQLYYASYPVFLSPRAVYMLVYDLSKGLNDLAQPCFKQGDRKIPLGNPNKETNMENLLSWLVSVSSICSSESEKAVKDQPHCRPPVFIVGTHADNLKQHQEDINKIELQIKREISENSQNVIRPIFSVDNTQGSSDRGVSTLQKRMIEVLKQEPYMGEEIPIRWFNFEKVVKALVAKKVYHLNMEQLQTIIQKHCFIENKDEVATMLNFYHDLGVIVKHGNTVILQAEWLIKLFKQLITVRCFDRMEPRHCRLWEEMEKTGVLNMELVEHVFSEFCQQGVAKEDILKMMMKFGLIVQFALSPTEEKYFVPCQLRSPPDNVCVKELSPGDPCPLYLDFQRMGYVPHGLYLQLVSRCTKWCSTSGFKRPPKLYDGASLFFIGKEFTHQMMLVCKKRFIKIVLKQIKRNDGSSCEPVSAKEVPILVRTSLNEMMQNLPEALPWLKNVAYDLCVKCPYCLNVEKRCANHDQFPCDDERCLCLMTVAPDGSCGYCLQSHLGEILPLPELKRWFPSSSEDSLIKDTSEEEVETRTVSQKRLPTSIRQFPDKEGYQVKEGVPTDEDLERLSVKIEKWKPLGRRLKLESSELEALHKDNEEWSEKAFAMLMKWKQKKGSDATYRCLYDALCHDLVNRKDLAEEFCCSCSKPEG